MLVVEPSSSCDICLEPYDWDDSQRIPHIIDCGHVFCAHCLHQVSPTRCPMCRKLFLPSEVRKLHVECSSYSEHEEMDLLNQLIMVYDSTEEEILNFRNRVDAWLSDREPNLQSPLRKARDALEQYQQLKLKRASDRRKIKTLEKAARQWERSFQDTTTRKEAEAAIMEQALRSQIAEQKAQIAQLRAEIDKKQAQLDRKVRKAEISRPLPLPKAPVVISNPLPTPPRLIRVTPKKPIVNNQTGDEGGTRGDLHSRLPIYERDDGFNDAEAYFTCLTAPYTGLDDEDLADEPLLRRPVRVMY